MTLRHGPPRKYSHALADRICERLSDGESLNAICKTTGYPTEARVRQWAVDDLWGFSSKYARARAVQAHFLAEEILTIANTPILGRKTKISESGTEVTEGDMIEHRRLQVDARKWYLSKVLPKVYGDKITHLGDTENPLQVVTRVELVAPPAE